MMTAYGYVGTYGTPIHPYLPSQEPWRKAEAQEEAHSTQGPE